MMIYLHSIFFFSFIFPSFALDLPQAHVSPELQQRLDQFYSKHRWQLRRGLVSGDCQICPVSDGIIQGLETALANVGLDDDEGDLSGALEAASDTDFSTVPADGLEVSSLITAFDELAALRAEDVAGVSVGETVLIAVETILNTVVKSLDTVYDVGLGPVTQLITSLRKIINAVPSTDFVPTLLNEIITYTGNLIVFLVGRFAAPREFSPECAAQTMQCQQNLLLMNTVPALVGELYLIKAMPP